MRSASPALRTASMAAVTCTSVSGVPPDFEMTTKRVVLRSRPARRARACGHRDCRRSACAGASRCHACRRRECPSRRAGPASGRRGSSRRCRRTPACARLGSACAGPRARRRCRRAIPARAAEAASIWRRPRARRQGAARAWRDWRRARLAAGQGRRCVGSRQPATDCDSDSASLGAALPDFRSPPACRRWW